MALRMAQPQRHPKTGVFRFRRVVPVDLRALVGKTEELISLGTKDPAEARVRYAKLSVDVEARWANLRKPPQTLSEREAAELAAAVHDAWLDRHRDNPSEPTSWRTDLYDQLWAEPTPWDMGRPMKARVGELAAALVSPARDQERWCVAQADFALSERGLRVDEAGRTKLARAVANAVQRASLTLDRAARGDFGDLPPRPVTPSPSLTGPEATRGSPPKARVSEPATLSISGLFEAWWQEAKGAGRKPSTYEGYEKTVRYLVAFLKHDDATRITAEDVVAFKDHRLATPSPRTGKLASAKTVKDSDLAALKTLFGWAVINRKLPTNPATGLTIKVGKRPRVRPKGFVEAEAHAILSAALRYEPGNQENPRTAAAKRWLPWLCAFSGARIGEMAQLRREDLRQEGDLWVLQITPDAGTVKINEARDVVLHPQLVELGFPAFVEASSPGPLFLMPGKGGDVLGPLGGLKNRMREFIRPIVPDPNVQPNHGWRHLFTTTCEEAEINPRVYNAIMGHAGRTVAEKYGDVTLKARAAAIQKMPSFDLANLGRPAGGI